MDESRQQTIAAIVGRLRDRFLAEYEANGELYHEVDVQRVRSDDWQIERFAVEHGLNEDAAYEALVRALKWKKEFGIHDRTDHYFPKEYFEWSETQTYGRDREGRLIQWEKVRNHRKISEMNPLTKQFVAHMMEKIDAQEGRKGFVLVSDTNGSGLSNIDMDVFKFKIELTAYYPEAMRLNLNVDMPWLLNGVAKVIVSLCGAKLRESVKFISRKELLDYVDPEVLPIELGGKREPKIVSPDGVLTLKQLPQLGLADSVIHKYYKSFGRSV